MNKLSVIILSTLPLWILTYTTNLLFISVIAAIFSVVVLIYWFWQLIKKPHKMLSLLKISSAYLVLVQNLSWLISIYFHTVKLNVSFEKSLASLMVGGLTISDYAFAIIYITLFATILSILGNNKYLFNKELLLFNSIKLQINNLSYNIVLILVLIISLLELSLFFKGIIGQRTIVYGEYSMGKIPIWLVLFESLSYLHIILASVLFTKSLGLKNKFITLILYLPVLLLFFTKGRGPFLFTILFVFYWYIFFSNRKVNYKRITIIILLLYPILSTLIMFNNFIRSQDSGLNENRTSAILVIPQAWKRFNSSGDFKYKESKRTEENLATRPLVATPLALSLKLKRYQKSFAYGKNILNSFIWVIPRQLSPNKTKYKVQEELLYSHFKIGKKDTADSQYLSAYLDFGWIGIIIYPVLIFTIWFTLLFLLVNLQVNIFIILLSLSQTYNLYISGMAESSLITWFTVLRSLLFWILIVSPIINALINKDYTLYRKDIRFNNPRFIR